MGVNSRSEEALGHLRCRRDLGQDPKELGRLGDEGGIWGGWKMGSTGIDLGGKG